MELTDLVGIRILSGVDFGTLPANKWGDSPSYINFIMDGQTYRATEDPEDGYRSSMAEIELVDDVVSNVFPGVLLNCDMGTGDHSQILYCTDLKTNQLVLEVGTDHYDDYYPMFTASFIPEMMSINQGRE